MKPIQKTNTVTGSGSVWNNNSYHWEQKSVDKWSEETLKKVMSNFKFQKEDASYSITDIMEFKGESSVNIRKNKKIVTYDYQVKLAWKVEVGADQISGEVFWPEISNDIVDDGDEWEARVSTTVGSEKVNSFISQIIKELAPSALRKAILKDFVEELKKK
jgi:activator of HSP90 ATPase